MINVLAFMCHHNVFLLYGSVEGVTQEKWDRLTHYSVGTSFIVATLFGVLGYATFTGFTQGKPQPSITFFFNLTFISLCNVFHARVGWITALCTRNLPPVSSASTV
jgi:amino acid permease